MRILLVSTAFSGLTQRFYTELDDAGYNVSIELHLGNEDQLQDGIDRFQPDLIICPYLTRKIPASIYQRYQCLIVHPGIKGDRGPSSLDWAIQEGVPEWGVTILEADDEMDAGPIWASKTFPLRPASKSSLFNREVTQAAVDALWQVLTFFSAPEFKPETLDYSRPAVSGRLRPKMKQTDRALDWQRHGTEEIVRRIQAADGSPGVLDQLYGQEFYLFNAQPEYRLRGKPGNIIAIANQAICRATSNGAVWIGHLKAKKPCGIKLPATLVLQDLLPKPAQGLKSLFSNAIKHIDIDYRQAGQQWPCQEVWYERHGDAAYLHFAFHNGGMSTAQCQLLLSVYRHLLTLNVKAIVLLGGEDNWSNGIHLNHIEAAADPAAASWHNINAIDDLILQILTTLDKLTVAAISANAGAGGAILAIAADKVWVRDGVVFNPHYKNMGELYGSEYWTYLLPQRVGQTKAAELTEQRLPISAKKAWHWGMVDKVLDRQPAIFNAQVRHQVDTLLAGTTELQKFLTEKSHHRCRDEAVKPLAAYRQFELTQMYANFYGNQAYHQARQDFVFKKPISQTPVNLAKHRQDSLSATAIPGSLIHAVWQDHYAIGDDHVDNQHKDFFQIAGQLLASRDKDELMGVILKLYQHVKEHFGEEEALMKKSGFHRYQTHAREHNYMLEKLLDMDHKIKNDTWNPSDIEGFIEKWTQHIINADMLFNQHWKEMNQFCL